MVFNPSNAGEVVGKRVSSKYVFSESVLKLVGVASEIAGVQLALVNRSEFSKSGEELCALRSSLEAKYAIAKTQVEHTKLVFEALDEEAKQVEGAFSAESLNRQKEELMKFIFLMNKSIKKLEAKRDEIHELNRLIGTFKSGFQDIRFTQAEVREVFGDRADAVMAHPKVSKREGPAAASGPDSKREGSAAASGPDNDGDVPMAAEDSAKPTQQTTYIIRVNLRQNADELQKLQDKLATDIKSYQDEIAQVKDSYLQNVRKLQKIKDILHS